MNSDRYKELEKRILLYYSDPSSEYSSNIQADIDEFESMQLVRNHRLYAMPKTEESERIEREQEDAKYLPFAKRQRPDEQNYAYVLENQPKIIKRILEESKKTSATPFCLDEIKQEAVIPYFNNPDYGFFNHNYDEDLPIISKREKVRPIEFLFVLILHTSFTSHFKFFLRS
jgi:hypothetical protein